MKTGVIARGILAMFLELIFASVSLPSDRTIDNSWNQRMAATYLDQRAAWWMAWPGSARGHGTFCISCHTAVPYALSRPALRSALGEQGASNSERALLENVRKRVFLWKDIEPFYSDESEGANKTAESRGTEAVLNALVLASHDAPHGSLSHDTQVALKNMWSLQVRSGSAAGAWWWKSAIGITHDLCFLADNPAIRSRRITPINFRCGSAARG